MDWGRNKARQRYASGGMIDASTGSVTKNPNAKTMKEIPGPSPAAYAKPKDMQGLPGPPSFKKPGADEYLSPHTRMLDQRARGYYDRRADSEGQSRKEQTPGENQRRFFRQLEQDQ